MIPIKEDIEAVEIDHKIDLGNSKYKTEKRYVLVSRINGGIIDDAQGYGFKTPQKAYAYLGWKESGQTVKAQKLTDSELKAVLIKKSKQ